MTAFTRDEEERLLAVLHPKGRPCAKCHDELEQVNEAWGLVSACVSPIENVTFTCHECALRFTPSVPWPVGHWVQAWGDDGAASRLVFHVTNSSTTHINGIEYVDSPDTPGGERRGQSGGLGQEPDQPFEFALGPDERITSVTLAVSKPILEPMVHYVRLETNRERRCEFGRLAMYSEAMQIKTVNLEAGECLAGFCMSIADGEIKCHLNGLGLAIRQASGSEPMFTSRIKKVVSSLFTSDAVKTGLTFVIQPHCIATQLSEKKDKWARTKLRPGLMQVVQQLNWIAEIGCDTKRNELEVSSARDVLRAAASVLEVLSARIQRRKFKLEHALQSAELHKSLHEEDKRRFDEAIASVRSRIPECPLRHWEAATDHPHLLRDGRDEAIALLDQLYSLIRKLNDFVEAMRSFKYGAEAGHYMSSIRAGFLALVEIVVAKDSAEWDSITSSVFFGPWQLITNSYCHALGLPNDLTVKEDQVYLKSHHGLFLCAEVNGCVVASRSVADAFETWTMTDNGDYVTLRSHHGKFLCAEPSGTLVANRAAASCWERFTIGYHGVLISLRSSHGKYVCADQARVVADRTAVNNLETWRVISVAESQSLAKQES